MTPATAWAVLVHVWAGVGVAAVATVVTLPPTFRILLLRLMRQHVARSAVTCCRRR